MFCDDLLHVVVVDRDLLIFCFLQLQLFVDQFLDRLFLHAGQGTCPRALECLLLQVQAEFFFALFKDRDDRVARLPFVGLDRLIENGLQAIRSPRILDDGLKIGFRLFSDGIAAQHHRALIDFIGSDRFVVDERHDRVTAARSRRRRLATCRLSVFFRRRRRRWFLCSF